MPDIRKTELLADLLEAYSAYFDVQESPDDSAELLATAQFHSRSEKYVLTKRAKLWALECHEYVYIFDCDLLTAEAVDHFKDRAIAAALELIEPHAEHMYSYITVIILADRLTPEGERRLHHCKFRKDFKFGLHGWASLRITAADSANTKLISNSPGKAVSKFIKTYFERGGSI